MTEVEAQHHLTKNTKGIAASVDLKSFDKRFACSQCKQEKILNNEITYRYICYVMTNTDCCYNKM